MDEVKDQGEDEEEAETPKLKNEYFGTEYIIRMIKHHHTEDQTQTLFEKKATIVIQTEKNAIDIVKDQAGNNT